MTSALGYRDLTDPVFNRSPRAFRHQHVRIEADGRACLFSLSPAGDRLHADLDGSPQPEKPKPEQEGAGRTSRRLEDRAVGGWG